MPDDAALGMLCQHVELAGQQARGGRAYQHVGPRDGADLGMQINLQAQGLGRAFLDEVSASDTLFNRADKAQPGWRSTRLEPLTLQRAPALGNTRAQLCFGIRCRIPGDHIQPVGQGPRDPAAADDAAAERGEGLDFGDK